MIDLSPLDRHKKIALSLSCGKDSLACLYLLRDHLHRITVYFHDTGDLLPEIHAIADQIEAMCPYFVRTRSDARSWIAQYGLPTDLLPYSAHDVGVMAGQRGAKLVTRYQCCFVNLMWPLWDRIKNDGNTLCIRGTKRADLKRLPAENGSIHEGVELWFPINDWSHDQVQDYLREAGAPRNPIYDHMTNSPECARCPAWWGEGRAAYLKARHPDLYRDYMDDLRIVAREIEEPLANLRRELG